MSHKDTIEAQLQRDSKAPTTKHIIVLSVYLISLNKVTNRCHIEIKSTVRMSR